MALTLVLGVTPAQAGAQFPGVGRPAAPAEIAAWDIDVRADFKGLPVGSGSVAKGMGIWDAKCASCHGTFAESNEVFPPLVGGTTADDMRTGHAKALVTGDQARTTFMKLAQLSTLWDYVRRAMPWNAPKSLSNDEVYAVVAYLLNLADIVPADFVLSNATMAEVQAKLPNRNGLTRDHGLSDIAGKPDTHNVACMSDCAGGTVASSLPEYAKDSHGNLTTQHRTVGGVRPVTTAESTMAQPAKVASAPSVVDLANAKGCTACHGMDKAILGPAFKDVAARYKGKPDALAHLKEKVRHGGSGAWGAIAMPGQSGLDDKELTALVQWVLSTGL